MLYKHILKPVLFEFDPESVHDFFTSTGQMLGSNVITRNITDAIYGYHGKDVSRVIDGIKYKTPVLLSAGFDYNGRLSQILPHIGLGGEEIGSITARPCSGNPKPRLTRLPKSESILVNKGLRNDGVDVIIERLRGVERTSDFVLGISIARTNDTGSVSVEEGIADYLYSFRRLNEEYIGDYYTINISCPNAFGGEAFTSPELLDRLLSALHAVKSTKPVYVKMPINIPWNEFEALLRVIDIHGLNGVVIGNLNKDYSSLTHRQEAPRMYVGGLSGLPCTHLSTDLIGKTRQTFGRRFTIFGVGGVMSVETAREKFAAGADLIQLISGLIFEGPGLVKQIVAGIGQK